MRKTFIPFIFLVGILCSLLFTHCQKEYSYEGGLPAIYSIEGSPGACMPVSVSGNYTGGIAVSSSEFITLAVDVTRAGYYNIFTVAVNGISFSSAGNFTDTGRQIVTLQGSGTPITAGNFTLKIAGINGCFFLLDVKKQTVASYTLSGYPDDCANPGIKGNYIALKNIAGATVSVNVNITVPGIYTIKTDTADGISFSASGYFSSTGNQVVILTGSGTPDTGGLIFFTVTADSSQCNFAVAVTNAEPLATYVLQSGNSSSGLICSPGSVQGLYTSGILLNSSNTLTVNAYVTVIGNYTISTNKIDGIVFRKTSAFTTLGAQDVVLTGSGTPIAAGSFLFDSFIIGPSPLGGNSCGLAIDVQ